LHLSNLFAKVKVSSLGNKHAEEIKIAFFLKILILSRSMNKEHIATAENVM